MIKNLDEIVKIMKVYRIIFKICGIILLIFMIPFTTGSFTSTKVSIITDGVFVIAFIICILIETIIKKEVANLKNNYKELQIKSESYIKELSSVICIIPNLVFLKGPDMGDRVVIISIDNWENVKTGVISKKIAEEIFELA